MKYTKLFLFAVLSALTISCNKEMESNQPAAADGITEITASFADDQTKTVLDSDGTSILWSPNDEISVFYNEIGLKFTALNSKPTACTVFASDKALIYGRTENESSPFFYAAYPYSSFNEQEGDLITLAVPASQTAVEGSFGRGAYPSVGRSKNTDIAFYNVCGGVCFSLTQPDVQYVTFRGNNNENIAGKVKVQFNENGVPEVAEVVSGSTIIQLNAPTSAGFVVGKTYYFSVLPQTLSNGFTMEFNKASVQAVRNSSSSVTVKRSIFGKLSNADQGLDYVNIYADLSSAGTANCYVVNKAGYYKFKATVKGGSTESVGTPASAEVLWESFGTDVTPTKGDIINNSVSLESGYVKFSTPSTINDGNAVIAVKDASNNILWSWHIWVCKDFDPASTAQVYKNSAGTMMDRNLGATSAAKGDVHALGLLYQWGRKDPFLSGNSISSDNGVAASTLSWPSSVGSDSSKGTIAYAVAHPTTFITENNSNNDWYYTGSSSSDNIRWQKSDKEKGLYDPCPVGWRVPDGGDNGVWSKAFGESSYYLSGPWDGTNRGMEFGSGNGKSSGMQLGTTSTIWYPAAGCRNDGDGSLGDVGGIGHYWSCTPFDGHACLLFFNYGGVGPFVSSYRAYGFSVRCLSE